MIKDKCNKEGHDYREHNVSDLSFYREKRITKIRSCKACKKTQWYFLGVWIEPLKEPTPKKPKQVDSNQMVMF